jgi:hypothetical protein
MDIKVKDIRQADLAYKKNPKLTYKLTANAVMPIQLETQYFREI